MAKAKPFIKWVGGKGQLLEQLEALHNIEARQIMFFGIWSHYDKKTESD